jgi:hypothetical protein
MVIPNPPGGVVRVTLTLDPIDVDLIDRLAKLEGMNRSQELRGMLQQLRPMLQQTVEAFESALAQRDAFDLKAAELAISGLEDLLPEVEALSRQYIGALSRIEGKGAARVSDSGDEAPASNTGATLE